MASQVVSVLAWISIIVLAAAQIAMDQAEMISTPALIAQDGYQVEVHMAQTSDGYLLQLHRVLAPAQRRCYSPSRPVLLMHGLMGSSDQWVLMGPDRSLAYLLVDAGYDVWLGNFRGNQYTTHKTLTRNDSQFWEFSFHEHGFYDIPAMIDLILEESCASRLLYVGHSMGCSSLLAMLSLRPEYNDNLVAFIGLAPAGYLDQLAGLAHLNLLKMDLANKMRAEGMYYMGLPAKLLDKVVNNLCTPRVNTELCMSISAGIVGRNYDQIDWEMAPIWLGRLEVGSLRQFEHFAKIALTDVFTEWAGGLDGPVKPYDFSKVEIPVNLYYGDKDILTPRAQTERLAEDLEEAGVDVTVGTVEESPFNHMDFLFARDVGELLNRPLISVIDEKFENDQNSEPTACQVQSKRESSLALKLKQMFYRY